MTMRISAGGPTGIQMSQDQRAQARARALQATPPPFRIFGRENYAGFRGAGYPVHSGAILDDLGNRPQTEAGFSARYDAELYAHARADILALVNDCERLESRLSRLTRPKPRWKGRAG